MVTVHSQLPVLRRSLLESWRATLGWTIGVAAALLLYLPLFPSIGGNDQMQQLIDGLPPELVSALGYDQIGSGAGYTQATFYGLIGFLILSIAAITWGASAVAGAEESGRLELDLAHGIGRVQYVIETSLAVIVRLCWLVLFASVLVIALSGPSELDLGIGDVGAAALALGGLVLLIGAVMLFVGAASGRKTWALFAGTAVAVGGYAVNAVANQSPDLGWLRVFSPYAWAYHQPPLTAGVNAAGVAALFAVSLVCLVLAAALLNRRDISG